MAWLKKNFLFTFIMLVFVAVLGVQAFYMLGQRGVAGEKEETFDRKVDEYRQLTGQDILPHRRNVERTAAEIDRQREELELFHSALQGNIDLDEFFGEPPGSRSDAFFEIASFVDEYQSRWGRVLEMQNFDDEYFSFEAYASAGPDQDRIPEVHRQRVIVGYIMDQLLEVRPRNFHGIERQGENGGVSVDPRLSLATDGVTETIAFRVSFGGYSGILRDFINRISSYEIPLVVRSVEVTSDGEDRGRRTTGRDTEEETDHVRIVEASPSRYVVTMEFLDVQPLPEHD